MFAGHDVGLPGRVGLCGRPQAPFVTAYLIGDVLDGVPFSRLG